jgi:branched-chain amino acid transport system permease protein
VGAYTAALLASPHLTSQFAWIAALAPGGCTSVLIVVPIAMALAATFGSARCADAASARRLPGHRDAGLRRNRPDLHEQPRPSGEHHQRPEGHHGVDPVHIFGFDLSQTHSLGFQFRRSTCITTCS